MVSTMPKYSLTYYKKNWEKGGGKQCIHLQISWESISSNAYPRGTH